MATNKNQHFVPRCYLKPFTLDGAGAAINLFNVDRLAFVRNAPVKHQCSGDYFYGQDEKLETAIRFLEESYGAALSEIIEPRFVLDHGHRIVLQRFWLFQYMRTEAASRRTVEMQVGMFAAIGEHVDNFSSSIKEAVQVAMGVYVDAMDAIDDLKVCLIRNRTSVPFVTSDDPAVMTNRWHLEDTRVRNKSPGLGSAGAIMLLPLTPQVLCVIYDGDVYSIAHVNGWVDLKRDADARAFNEHQFLNSLANIYLRDWTSREGVRNAFLVARPLRPAARHRLHYAVYDGRDGDTDRYRVVQRVGASSDERAIIHSQTIIAKPSVWPRQIAWRTPGAAYANGTGVGYIRRALIDRYPSGGFRKVRTR